LEGRPRIRPVDRICRVSLSIAGPHCGKSNQFTTCGKADRTKPRGIDIPLRRACADEA
jgi:hypothetical protein